MSVTVSGSNVFPSGVIGVLLSAHETALSQGAICLFRACRASFVSDWLSSSVRAASRRGLRMREMRKSLPARRMQTSRLHAWLRRGSPVHQREALPNAAAQGQAPVTGRSLPPWNSTETAALSVCSSILRKSRGFCRQKRYPEDRASYRTKGSCRLSSKRLVRDVRAAGGFHEDIRLPVREIMLAICVAMGSGTWLSIASA